MLSQINALVAGEKKRSGVALTELYHLVQRAGGPLSGVVRVYTPTDDEGERLPPESTRVQTRVEADILPRIAGVTSRIIDLQFTQDDANCTARADVVVGGTVIIAQAPVTYLLYLEKVLTDLHTVLGKVPTLDLADVWSWNGDIGAYQSMPVNTIRSKKVPRNHVRAAATDKHPAQVDVWQEDIPVGTWTTTKLSGAVPDETRRVLAHRIETLIDAVRVARDEANKQQVEDRHAADTIFGFLFSGAIHTTAAPAAA